MLSFCFRQVHVELLLSPLSLVLSRQVLKIGEDVGNLRVQYLTQLEEGMVGER